MKDYSVVFEPDAVIGSFNSPVILTDNKVVTGIKELAIGEDGDYEVYSVQGYLIFRGKNNADQLKTLPPGVYIVNGKKRSIK